MKFITDDRGKVETHFRMSKQGRHTTTIKQFGPKTMIEVLDKFSQLTCHNNWIDIKVTAAGSKLKPT